MAAARNASKTVAAAARAPSRFWNAFGNMGALMEHGKVNIVGGKDAVVWDSNKKKYIDALASLWYVNIGHGRQEVADAVAKQMKTLSVYQTFEFYTNKPAEELASVISEYSQMPEAKVFFTLGGSDAIDTAGKLVRAYWTAMGKPSKRTLISRVHSYHGMNGFGTSLTGIPLLTGVYDPVLADVVRVAWNDPEALASEIDKVGADNVAAFFCEPIIGAGGVIPPPEGYLQKVRKICADRNVLFVADEVICGFGRTGHWFGSTRWDLKPDIMTCAKGLTSGYLPLGCVVIGQRVADPFYAKGTQHVFRHGFTYSGHPSACAAGLANLDIIRREKLMDRVKDLEPKLRAALDPLAKLPTVSAVRAGVGLLGAVELSEEARKARPDLLPAVVKAARDRGVITRGIRGVALQVSPPFVITEKEIKEVAEVLSDAIQSVKV